MKHFGLLKYHGILLFWRKVMQYNINIEQDYLIFPLSDFPIDYPIQRTRITILKSNNFKQVFRIYKCIKIDQNNNT